MNQPPRLLHSFEPDIPDMNNLLGTIGFGLLIAAGGLPCFWLAVKEPAYLILGSIAVLFGVGWALRTFLVWRSESIVRSVELYDASLRTPSPGEMLVYRARITATRAVVLQEVRGRLLVRARPPGGDLEDVIHLEEMKFAVPCALELQADAPMHVDIELTLPTLDPTKIPSGCDISWRVFTVFDLKGLMDTTYDHLIQVRSP